MFVAVLFVGLSLVAYFFILILYFMTRLCTGCIDMICVDIYVDKMIFPSKLGRFHLMETV